MRRAPERRSSSVALTKSMAREIRRTPQDVSVAFTKSEGSVRALSRNRGDTNARCLGFARVFLTPEASSPGQSGNRFVFEIGVSEISNLHNPGGLFLFTSTYL